MSQLQLFEPVFWTVSQLTGYLRDLMESDSALQDLWVTGEVSNLARPSSGHLYFTLKDRTSSLRCVIWRSNASRITLSLTDGMAVEAHGNLSIYEAGGQYQLYADTIRLAGEGILYQEFMRLKVRLEAEGLFDTERKRPIPSRPSRIGIITSPTGAALRDILNTIKRRYPLVQILLAPTPVQGDEAPPAIVSALQNLNRIFSPEVIILARGGGSIEDLWAFNDERLARAILESIAPVICGVGHETDFTIADFVCDLRAPTPTAAAELATPDKSEILAAIIEFSAKATRSIQKTLANARWELNTLNNQLELHSPRSRLRSYRQSLDELTRVASISINHYLHVIKLRNTTLHERLIALNPLLVLERGFASISTPTGVPVKSIAQVSLGDDLYIRLKDGRLSAQAKGPLPEK